MIRLRIHCEIESMPRARMQIRLQNLCILKQLFLSSPFIRAFTFPTTENQVILTRCKQHFPLECCWLDCHADGKVLGNCKRLTDRLRVFDNVDIEWNMEKRLGVCIYVAETDVAGIEVRVNV